MATATATATAICIIGRCRSCHVIRAAGSYTLPKDRDEMGRDVLDWTLSGLVVCETHLDSVKLAEHTRHCTQRKE